MTIEERFDMILLVGEKHRRIADIAQVVVRILGKDEVTSSSLVISCKEIPGEPWKTGPPGLFAVVFCEAPAYHIYIGSVYS